MEKVSVKHLFGLKNILRGIARLVRPKSVFNGGGGVCV